MVACSITRPRAITAALSHTRSTSARMWVLKNTVVRPRRPSTISSSSRRPMGSSALVGSSSKKQARGIDQRLGHAQALLHAPRVAADAGVHGAQAGQVEQRRHALVAHGGGEAEQLARQLQELARRHPAVEAGHVRQVADEAVHGVGLGDDVVAEHVRRAGRGSRQPGEDAQGGGLAGAVGAKEAEHRAFRHREVHAVQGARPRRRLC